LADQSKISGFDQALKIELLVKIKMLNLLFALGRPKTIVNMGKFSKLAIDPN